MSNNIDDIFYKSSDGLTLYARDYGKNSKNLVVLCMHGLTRNSDDFHNLALHLKDSFRVISVDQRGRGRSDYDLNGASYKAEVYCADMFTLLAHLNLDNVIAIGTSMGGIMTMMMAAQRPGIFRAAILNDIGPEINPSGLERIKGYIGQSGPFESWEVAAKALQAQGPDVFPDYTDDDWMEFARRTCSEPTEGVIKFAYDPKISEPFKTDYTVAAPVDMWPIFLAVSNIPVLSIRGELSDLLSSKTIEKMKLAHPELKCAEIPRVGHAPMLDEPESLAAIDAFLKAYQ